MPVLLWGLSTERPLAAVGEELARLGVAVLVVDQHRVLETGIRFRVWRELEGAIRTDNEWTDLAAVSAAYLRPSDSRQVPAVTREGPESLARRHSLALDHVVACWS